MTTHKSIHAKIAAILRKKGTRKALEKAEIIEGQLKLSKALHLRDLELHADEVLAIAKCLNQVEETVDPPIHSISFSYNPLLGNAGATALAKNLSNTIGELGLVNCQIGDVGGYELLNWMNNSTNLQMVCIEQNNFSQDLKMAFKKFRDLNPKIMLVF